MTLQIDYGQLEESFANSNNDDCKSHLRRLRAASDEVFQSKALKVFQSKALKKQAKLVEPSILKQQLREEQPLPEEADGALCKDHSRGKCNDTNIN